MFISSLWQTYLEAEAVVLDTCAQIASSAFPSRQDTSRPVFLFKTVYAGMMGTLRNVSIYAMAGYYLDEWTASIGWSAFSFIYSDDHSASDAVITSWSIAALDTQDMAPIDAYVSGIYRIAITQATMTAIRVVKGCCC